MKSERGRRKTSKKLEHQSRCLSIWYRPPFRELLRLGSPKGAFCKAKNAKKKKKHYQDTQRNAFGLVLCSKKPPKSIAPLGVPGRKQPLRLLLLVLQSHPHGLSGFHTLRHCLDSQRYSNKETTRTSSLANIIVLNRTETNTSPNECLTFRRFF